MVKAIRKSVLIHSVLYAKKTVDDLWDEGTFQEPVKVNYVRLEPKEKLVRSNVGESIQSDTTLFWDSVHSTPVDWIKGSQVTFNDRLMTVEGIDEYYDSHRLHHLEVRLV